MSSTSSLSSILKFILFALLNDACVLSQQIKRSDHNSFSDVVGFNSWNVMRELKLNSLFPSIDLFSAKNNSNASINNTLPISPKCREQMSIFQSSFVNYEEWALKMFDASSKIPSGILQGNLIDMGMYDECHSIKIDKNNITISGRHCMYTVSAHIAMTNMTLSPSLSICLPSVCNVMDIHGFLQSAVDIILTNQTDLHLDIGAIACSSVYPKPLDLGALITLIALGILTTFLIACTIVDVLLTHEKINIRIPGKFFQFLLQFSLLANGRRILSTVTPKKNLPAISGIRVLSMSWVILGHTYVHQLFGVLINPTDLLWWVSSWKALHILIAPFAVDTFFVLSGFLTSFLFLREMTKERKFNLISYYTHRYVRLTPAFAALLLLTIFVFPRMGSGALWEKNMTQQKHFCSRNWWHMLLYVHNYGGLENIACLGHTWYLAVDMQFFWISPIILYPLAKKPKLGLVVLSLSLIVSIITPAMLVNRNKFSAALINNLNNISDQMMKYYVATYARAGPWLLGIFVGYRLASMRTSHSHNFYLFGWVLTTVAFAISIFTYRIFQNVDYKFNIYWEMIYAGFSKHIWAFGICWIIYTSALGHSGPIGRFLSLPIFLPFSRISYCIYLVHFLIQTMRISSARTSAYFSDMEMVYSFISDVVLCTIAGFVFSLLFESPFLVIEKVLTTKKTLAKNENQEEL